MQFRIEGQKPVTKTTRHQSVLAPRKGLVGILLLTVLAIAAALLARVMGPTALITNNLWTIAALASVSACVWWARLFMSRSRKQTFPTVCQSQLDTRGTYQDHLSFLNTISDDIRLPLVGIVGAIRQMVITSPHREMVRQLSSLYEQSLKLQSRLNNALELGRVATNTATSMRSTDLSQVAADIAEHYSQTFFNRPNLLLSILVDHRLPKLVSADPRRLILLISNLLENSLQFSQGGQIIIRITSPDPFQSIGENIAIDISCSDCGCGISPSHLQEINRELINSLESHHDYKAIGIGLRAAMRIVTDYQGTLTLSSKQDHGTVATARIIVRTEAPALTWDGLPSTLYYMSRSKDMEITLHHIGLFHALAVSEIALHRAGSPDNIFIDATDLARGVWGTYDAFIPKGKYVVVLRADQPELRDELLNQGFTRFLTLPLVSTNFLHAMLNEDAPLISHPPQSPQKRSAGNILVVDDSETNRLRITYHLRGNGFQVTEASDGLEMVALLKSDKRFDLVLSDLTMPHLNGEDAVRQIRSFENHLGIHTPIVAITAYTAADIETTTKAAGFDAILRKPVFLDELDYLITRFMTQTEDPMKETNLIDLEDLKQRSAGKTRLMAMLLD